MINLKGVSHTYDWVDGPPETVEDPTDKAIQRVNYAGRHDPVAIGLFEGSDVYGGELTPYSVFPTWNHWPVAQMPSDCRSASFRTARPTAC